MVLPDLVNILGMQADVRARLGEVQCCIAAAKRKIEESEAYIQAVLQVNRSGYWPESAGVLCCVLRWHLCLAPVAIHVLLVTAVLGGSEMAISCHCSSASPYTISTAGCPFPVAVSWHTVFDMSIV